MEIGLELRPTLFIPRYGSNGPGWLALRVWRQRWTDKREQGDKGTRGTRLPGFMYRSVRKVVHAIGVLYSYKICKPKTH